MHRSHDCNLRNDLLDLPLPFLDKVVLSLLEVLDKIADGLDLDVEHVGDLLVRS